MLVRHLQPNKEKFSDSTIRQALHRPGRSENPKIRNLNFTATVFTVTLHEDESLPLSPPSWDNILSAGAPCF